MSLYQQLLTADNLEIFKQFKQNFFDLIIIDECHRGSAKEDSNWRKILEYFSSATQIGGNNAYLSKGVGFLRAENIGENGKLCLDNLKYINLKTHFEFLKRSILEENDLLITIAGTLGRIAKINKYNLPLNTNRANSIIRLINSNIIQKNLKKQTKITAIPNLTLEIISNLLLPLPPLSEQQRIVEKIEEIFDIIDNKNILN